MEKEDSKSLLPKEKSFPHPLDSPTDLKQPVELNISQKILPYDKHIILWNHKSAKSAEIKQLLLNIKEKGISHESEFAICLLKIMILGNQSLYSQRERMSAFCRFASSVSGDKKITLFTKTIPFIANLALQAELMFLDGTVPFLSMSKQNLIILSRREVACLLGNMFFCSIPSQNPEYDIGEYRFYCMMCDDMAYCQDKINEKLLCIFNYFDELLKAEPEGFITISRNSMSSEERGLFTIEKWLSSTKKLTKITSLPTGFIEDCHEALQVDFANKYVGGGIDSTCLQEQILFVIYPELFVTTLLCEKMDPYESIVITGVQQFSKYKGYSEDFTYAGKCVDPLAGKFDILKRIPRQVVAIDALWLPKIEDKVNQFGYEYVLRELNKAYVGFLGDIICNPKDQRAVATGKWGCGVFEGCTEFKLIIQWLAASEANRDIIFCLCGEENEKFITTLKILYGSTVGDVAKFLLSAGQKIAEALVANPDVNYDNLILELLLSSLKK